MSQELPKEIKRWTAQRKTALLLQEKERKIDQLHRKIGEMTMDFEVLEKANEFRQQLDLSLHVA